MSRVLGLDIGPNSIGWALIEEGASPRLVDVGVRVFPEGVDNFDTAREVSRNENRRMARTMRRQILRRRRRKAILRRALVSAGLLPSDPTALEALLAQDPYRLRARAAEGQRLEPHEIGRVLLHLNQRRGFLSSRKKDRNDSEVKGMLEEISALAAELNGRTLGQFLAEQAARPGERPVHRLRGRHTRRDMLIDEFDRIWKSQARHHPGLLTDTLRHGSEGPRLPHLHKPLRLGRGGDPLARYGIEGLIFFQRPMYWPKSLVGVCELEPREKRCPRADRAAQRFRLLQEVNNLRYIDPDDHREKALTDGQRRLVIEKLSAREKMTFDELRRALGFLDTVRFNLERGQRASLAGMKTDHLLASTRALGRGWRQRPEEEKDAIVRLLLDADRVGEAETKAALIDRFGFSDEEAERALAVNLPEGYARLSRKAIEKLLPFLEQGMPYMGESNPEASALHAAGYLRRDEMQRRLFDRLPTLRQLHTGPLADLPNPVVTAALYELRKVVNAVIGAYGKPDAIHVEMARSLRMPRSRREEYNRRIRQREAERAAAADLLRKQGVQPTREAILRYLLWKEQGEICIYTGRSISFRHLFEGEVDIDHILPYSQTLDDSQDNKVVAFRSANVEKGKRTPRQWLEGDAPRYEAVCQRARRLPYRKYRRFLQKEVELDDFIARQLRDTAYITRLAGEYLRLLVEPQRILGLKGQHTATLRYMWGLESLIAELPDSPAWAEGANLRDGEKNRADHRHHALDAIVVALTSRSRLQQLARIERQGGTRGTGEVLPEPMPRFRETVREKLAAVNVSHRPRRQVAGKLHEETYYGRVHDQQGRPVAGQFVVRKAVESLSAAEIERIRDAGIRRLVVARLKERGIDFGRGRAAAPGAIGKALAGLTMPSGVAVRKVRLLKTDSTIRPIRAGRPDEAWVRPASNHHACIFEWMEKGKPKREAIYVTRIEAARRLRNREPVVQRTHPTRPDARFVMSLCPGDMVLLEEGDAPRLMVITTLVAGEEQKRIHAVSATDARRSGDRHAPSITGKLLKLRKVTVDPLGRIRDAEAFRTDLSLEEIHPEILALAQEKHAGRRSLSWVKRQMRDKGLTHLGAQFSRALRLLKPGPA